MGGNKSLRSCLSNFFPDPTQATCWLPLRPQLASQFLCSSFCCLSFPFHRSLLPSPTNSPRSCFDSSVIIVTKEGNSLPAPSERKRAMRTTRASISPRPSVHARSPSPASAAAAEEKMPRDSVITVPLLRRSSSGGGGGNRVAVLDHLVIYRLIWEGALIYIRATSPFPSGYDVLTTASVIIGMDCGLGAAGLLTHTLRSGCLRGRSSALRA